MKTINKKKIAFIALTIIGTSALFAQKSGVYKTYSDYLAGKMEYGINCATEKHKIKLNDFWGKDYIIVIHDGKPYELKKSEIWGFQLCDEKVVRFRGKEHFPLEDKGVLWIYTKQSVKQISPRGGNKTINTYYFSMGGDGEIKELTLQSLKATFPDNHKLHDAIDAQFKTDASLEEYDQFHKHFSVNHFLDSQGIK